MEKKQVFISYSSKESSQAYEVKNILEINGISCWMAPESIPYGSNYAVEIPQAISDCVVFLLILSESSQSSVWVPKELQVALNKCKEIIPIHIDDSVLKASFDFSLIDVQRIEAYKRQAAAYEELVRRIRHILNYNQPEIYTAGVAKGADSISNQPVIAKDSYKNTLKNYDVSEDDRPAVFSSADNSKGKDYDLGHARTTTSAGIKIPVIPVWVKKPTDEVIRYSSGAVYEGGVMDNKPHGIGIIRWTSGSVYEGEWDKGEQNGRGRMTWKDGAVYEGEWVAGKQHGRGTMRFASNASYTGEYQGGKKNGYGTYTHANGDVYEGQWRDDKKNGLGTYTYIDGDVYEGQWVEDKKHGRGTFRFKSGTVYTGDYFEGIRTGKGKLVYASGSVYEGDFVDGNPHGQGKLTTKDGAVYEGGWKANKQHGHGIYTSAQGVVREGEWVEGKFQK